MDQVEELSWDEEAKKLTWVVSGQHVEVAYAVVPERMHVLRVKSGVAVLEPLQQCGPDNIVILNADGSIRARVSCPFPVSESNGFYDLYYVGDRLTAFVAVSQSVDKG